MTPDSTHDERRSRSGTVGSGLLGPDDPPAVEFLNPAGEGRAVLTADHAGRAFPAALSGGASGAETGQTGGDRAHRARRALGLEPAMLATHIGWDIGIGPVARRVADLLDAPAAIANYSRLVIDLNRAPGIESSIVEESDGVPIPGNRNLPSADRHARENAIFHPYHDAIQAMLDARAGAGRKMALVCLHSFTPVMDDFVRPWHIGILWNGRDGALALPLLESMRRDPDLCVGDNQPYDGRGDVGFTLQRHADTRNIPSVLIEVRQDLIETENGQRRWATLIADHLGPVLADDSIYETAAAGTEGAATAGRSA